MAEIIIWDIPSMFLGGIAFCILSIGGFLYLFKGFKSEVFNEKIVIFGYSGIFLSFACFILFYTIGAFNVAGTYKYFAFFVGLADINILSDILFRASYSSLFFGFLFYILLFEINFKRTKYILSIIGFLLNIASLIIAPVTSEIIIIPYVYNLLMGVLVLIMFTSWSKYEYRIISSYILIGIYCIGYSGGFLGMTFIFARNVLPIWIGPLLLCLGGIIMITTLFITPKNLSRSWLYGLFLCNFFVLGLQIIVMWYYIFAGVPFINIIIVVIFCLPYIYLLFSNIKAVKSYQIGSIPSQEKEFHPNILSMFVRPQKLTEEEVTVAKEKKICIICKNKVARFDIYICPECDTLYCYNCAKTLSDLENICWVCETPFDASKPFKTGIAKNEIEIEETEEELKKK